VKEEERDKKQRKRKGKETVWQRLFLEKEIWRVRERFLFFEEAICTPVERDGERKREREAQRVVVLEEDARARPKAEWERESHHLGANTAHIKTQPRQQPESCASERSYVGAPPPTPPIPGAMFGRPS
jgi:hypothetical protein